MTTDSATPPPPPAEPAATLILLRPVAAHTEVLMQVRHSDIAFAGGALVFPGGKLEPQDSDPALEACIDDTGVEGNLRTAKVAAIRETFEECGLMLARARGSGELVDASLVASLNEDRQRLNRGEQHFIDLLRRESLTLACDTLVHFAHWVTPEFMPRRFDTHFFLAQAPEAQEEVHDGTESVESVWIRPDEAIRAAARGRYKMLFPTRSILHRLAAERAPVDHLQIAGDTPVVTVAPRLVRRDTGTFIRIPDDIGYDWFEEKIEKG